MTEKKTFVDKEPSVRRSLAVRVFAVFALIVFLETAYLLGLTLLLELTQKQLSEAKAARETMACIGNFSSALQSGNTAIVDELRATRSGGSKTFAVVLARVPASLVQLRARLERNHNKSDDRIMAKMNAEVDDVLSLVKKIVSWGRDDVSPTLQDKIQHRIFVAQLLENGHLIDNDVNELSAKYSGLEREANKALFLESEPAFYTALLGGFLVNAAVAIIVYLAFVRGVIARLEKVAERMQIFGSNKKLPEALSGADEISRLDEAFRRTASKLLIQKSKESIVLAHASSFICSINRELLIVTAPEKSCELWGYTAEDLVGKRFLSLIKDDQSGSCYRALQELVSGAAKSATFESRIELAGGRDEVIEVSWNASRASLNNSFIVCIAHDVTERNQAQNLVRRSEEQFRSVIDSLPLGVITTGSDLKIESANPAAMRLSQYSLSELESSHLDMLFGEDLAPLMVQSLGRGKDREQINLLAIRRKDGDTMPVDLSISTYKLNSGDRLLFTFYDVSARREIEMAKRDFVSMIAHDLRSPLLAIAGTLSMLEGAESVPAIKDSESMIAALIALINDFLDLGKLEAGQKMLTRQNVSIEDLKQHLAQNSDLSFCDLQIVSQSAAVLNIDLQRIVDSIVYLCHLQMRLGPSEGSRVKILNGNLDDKFCLYVYSNGAKVPKVIRENCTEGYGLVPVGQYSGLHLGLCRAIIAAHGGTLQVEAVAGSDAFKIMLPQFGTRL